MQDIIKFYRGEIRNDNGNFFDEILGWDDEHLERSHRTVQWMFPLNEPSEAQPDSPVLSDFQVQQMKSDPQIIANLGEAITVWGKFYGLAYTTGHNDDGDFYIEHQIVDITRFNNWIKPFNHNYLRLTRMLKCMVLFGLQQWAISFYKCLKSIYDNYSITISAITMDYWSDAVRDVYDVQWMTNHFTDGDKT